MYHLLSTYPPSCFIPISLSRPKVDKQQGQASEGGYRQRSPLHWLSTLPSQDLTDFLVGRKALSSTQ